MSVWPGAAGSRINFAFSTVAVHDHWRKSPAGFCTVVRKNFGTNNMKSTTCTLALLLTISAHALDWTYSTNLFWGITSPTNLYNGTNGTDTGADNVHTWATKLNADINLIWHNLTNSTGGLSGILFTNTVTLPAGSPATVTNLGVFGGIAYFSISVPAGPTGTPGTNFVTVNQFSNVVLSSQQITVYSTNNAFWHGSNYLARVPGIYSWIINGGNDGGVYSQGVPGTIPVSLVGSYTGTNSWFTITNGFKTTNMISVALLTNGLSAFGGSQIAPGFATLYSVDHGELLGRTNYFFGQHIRFDAPSDPLDAANKSYVDTLFANAFNGNFYVVFTNNAYHLIYSFQNMEAMDIAGVITQIPITAASLDGTGTNLTFSASQSSLAGGYTMQCSTNLLLIAGFTTFTNFTTSTNAGVVTFTTPIISTQLTAFFRLISGSGLTTTFFTPVTASAGTLYPSNTWSLTSITNGMQAGDIITVNSNGLKLVDVWMSNSTPILKPHW